VSATSAILLPRNLPVLSGFALSNVLLAFDYDGTLAPIAPTPDRAGMRRTTRQLLARVSRRYPCVVISGRALDDITRRMRRIPLWYVFGNHGFEPAMPGARPSASTAEWLRRLREQLPDEPGVVIEDKTHTLTIHYRGARDRGRAVEAIDKAVRTLRDARVVGGSEAVNVLPSGGANKGAALLRALKLFACTTAIYVGDDATDEDAFGAMSADRMLGIRVGPARESRARYHLEGQHEIDGLLRALVDLRSPRFARLPVAQSRRS
jgi:trehalose 6-phosphate phosphatase